MQEWLREVKTDWADIELAENNSSDELDKLLIPFQDFFKPGIGEINSEQRDIQLKNRAKPIFIKPHQVPYTLKKSTEDKLDRLESCGIISKVENSQGELLLFQWEGQMEMCGSKYIIKLQQITLYLMKNTLFHELKIY